MSRVGGKKNMAETRANYRVGTLYSLVTIALLAVQHPLSLLAAEKFSVVNFVFATQVILLFSIPLLLRTSKARRDFRSLVTSAANWKYFFVLLVIGLLGHVLYFTALSKGHPVTLAAVLNLSPFWAAMVALVISKKAVPTSYATFFSCLALAFVGAMMIALSQSKDLSFSLNALGSMSPYWAFAIPVPICFALSGTLIGKWFVDFDEMACIAVTFVTSSAVLIPITALVSFYRSDLGVFREAGLELTLLTIGTVLGASVGLVVYQASLSVTDNDNGFVSMFFLLGPVVTSLLSLAMSPWIPALKFEAGPLFLGGMVVVAAPIFVFSWRARNSDRAAPSKRESREEEPALASS
jgi:drug/metabolite transporter (DMT)-like permease